MKEDIVKAYCDYFNNNNKVKEFKDKAIPNPKRNNFFIKLNMSVTIKGLHIFSGLRLMVFETGNNELQLFVWGIEYGETGENRKIDNDDEGNDYEDDVRRIRNEIDLHANPIFEVNDKGMVLTKKSVGLAKKQDDITYFNLLVDLYINARSELLKLYENTQSSYSDFQASFPPRGFDYRNGELTKFYYDHYLFEESKKRTVKYAYSRDGFYPYYLEQTPRILVLGRSSREMGGRDYIETTCGNLQKEGKEKTSRITMETIGCLLKRIDISKEDPTAKDMAKDLRYYFARPKNKGGFSYAFINVCPIDQEKTHFEKKEDSIYWKAFSASKDLLRQRIEELEPDCIIALSINGPNNELDVVETLFDYGCRKIPCKNPCTHLGIYAIKLKTKNESEIPLLQTKYHPSSKYKEWSPCQKELISKFLSVNKELWERENPDYLEILRILAN